MSDQERQRENIYYFQETEGRGGFQSGAVNLLAQLRLNNFPTTTAAAPIPNGDHRTTTTTNPQLRHCTVCGGPMRKRSSPPPSLHEPTSKKITLRPSPTTAATVLGGDCTLHGFTKLPLPITSPIVWASGPPPSAPTLRRCISDPINSPGTDKTRALSSQLSDSCTVFASPLSPENAITTLSPAKASSSASATLPPIAPILRQAISDPSPSGCQVKTTPPDSIKLENPNLERMKRMKDRMREMSQWWDEVLREEEKEEEADSGSEDDKNCAPKDETETEEAVSVERSGNCLIIHIKCPCGKGYQVLLSGRNCYYKLM
ncbi:uncharacterized protein LOC130782185 [Actinidia eriantha]|uniref:uncharacterized protein LOC130782185 n=1 Tax=Actinidia eriantha TaxID=165200 RepID=UPI0025901F40|nr:uncharacterized protein LOC130782185 [Actinidia eriantha]